MSKFCERFKELRKEKSYTQRQLGEIFNLANNTISSWERGNSNPSPEELIMIAKFFEVSLDYLLGLTD